MHYFNWKQRPLSELSPGFRNLYTTQVASPTAEDDLYCCWGRGTAHALDEIAQERLPPPIPGLQCDLDHTWDKYLSEK